MLDFHDRIRTPAKLCDYDAHVRVEGSVYTWKPDPNIALDKETGKVCWKGEWCGKYMVRGLSKSEGCLITAEVMVVLPLSIRPQLHSQVRLRFKRLFAAVCLWRQVKETDEIPLISRVTLKFVEVV